MLAVVVAQDNNYGLVYDAAAAFMTLQRAYGLIPHIIGKGEASKVRSLNFSMFEPCSRFEKSKALRRPAGASTEGERDRLARARVD